MKLKFIGAGIALYVSTRPGRALDWLFAGNDKGGVDKDKPAPDKPAPDPPAPVANQSPAGDPARSNPDFKKMVDRLIGRWNGKLDTGGSVAYDYRANGTFALNVDGVQSPISVSGSWHVVGVGAESLRIKRQGAAPPSDWYEPDDFANVSFLGPNVMQQTLKQGVSICAREGSSAKAEAPLAAQHTQAVMAAVTRLGGQVDTTDVDLLVLDLKGKDVTDGDLSILKGPARIVALNLAGNPRVSDTVLAYLQDSSDLEQLNLTGTAVTDKGLALLKRHRRLTRLYCGNPGITDAGMPHLLAFPDLLVLDFVQQPRHG